MSRNTRTLDRRSYLTTTGLATAGMIGLAGCTGDSELTSNGDDDNDSTDETADGDDDAEETHTGTLSTSVTDQPNDIGDFESLVITIDGIWIKPADSDGAADTDDEASDVENDDAAGADSETDAAADDADADDDDADSDDADSDDVDDNGDGSEDDESSDDTNENGDSSGQGRRYIAFDEPQEADLVELQGDNTQLIDETTVDVGSYRFLQLDVSNTEGVLTEDGSDADVETPGNAPLQFNAEFEIRADEQTRFIADFAPQRRGQQGSYIVRPVASGTRVLYGDEEYTADDDTNGEGDDDNGEPNGDDDANRNETSSPNGDNETGTQNGPENGE